jgi:iron(III) transport system ATP-binding protein
MISIQIKKLTKRFGPVVALQNLDLTINPGELFFLLGPSGCGKTTLLRCLAGFCSPDEGRIWFGEEEVTALAPHRRNAGMVFQSYALWPHLTVAENVSFGLEERQLPRDEIRRRTRQALEAAHLVDCFDRKPNELSGGQQQRVALARALVVRPRCLLLDEPLSNLDARLRVEMRGEIRRVCKEFQLTAVYVTHDQKEALSIADRLAVMEAGRILQVGTPREIYRRPARRKVAGFIGDADFIPGKVVAGGGGRAVVETALGRIDGVLGDPTLPPKAGDEVTVSIRPECWVIGREQKAQNCIEGVIGNAVYLGEMARYDFVCAGMTLKIVELNPRFIGPMAEGKLQASVDPEDAVVLVE